MLLNVAMEVDIANRTRGEIQDIIVIIILDEQEDLSAPDKDGAISTSDAALQTIQKD